MKAMLTYQGMPVIVSYDQPGYVLPLDLPLPLEFRQQFNEWAASFFRRKPSFIPDGQVVFTNPGGLFGPGGRQMLHMNERTFAEFKKVIGNAS